MFSFVLFPLFCIGKKNAWEYDRIQTLRAEKCWRLLVGDGGLGKHLGLCWQQHVRDEACAAGRSLGGRKAANLNRSPVYPCRTVDFEWGIDSFPGQEVESIFGQLNVFWYVENKDNEGVSHVKCLGFAFPITACEQEVFCKTRGHRLCWFVPSAWSERGSVCCLCLCRRPGRTAFVLQGRTVCVKETPRTAALLASGPAGVQVVLHQTWSNQSRVHGKPLLFISLIFKKC